MTLSSAVSDIRQPSSNARVLSDAERAAYADILSQAIVGELIGMENFALLAQTATDVAEKMDAIEHANAERAHAASFMRAAEKLGLAVNVDVDARYWKRARDAFRKYAEAGDFIACHLAQEIMLESLAVSTYEKVGAALGDEVGELFGRVAKEEKRHLRHYLGELRELRAKDPQWFEDKVYEVHQNVMTTIAEMIARDDPGGHCGLCHGGCVKDKLTAVNLDLNTLRGGTIQLYLTILDDLGLPGEKTIQWVGELPA